MSACEKCWSDAGRIAMSRMGDKVEIYRELMDERRANPCTPEQQAGPDADECPMCHRDTIHQHTGECMSIWCGVRLR